MVHSPLARQIVALGVALSVVALSLAYPLRGYLQQQAAERQAVAEQHVLEGQIGDLKAQIAALKDPAYIRAEAKRRLQYVTPGDTVYVVKLPPSLAAKAQQDTGTVDSTVDAGIAAANGSDTATPGGTTASDKAPPGSTAVADDSVTPSSAVSHGDAAKAAAGGTAGSSPAPWYSSLWSTLSGSQE